MPRPRKTPALPPSTSHLGVNLRALRKARGWNQADLAKKAGVHITHISRIETGNYGPSVELVERLMEIFKVDANAFLLPPRGVTEEERAIENLVQKVRSLSPNRRESLALVADHLSTGHHIENITYSRVEPRIVDEPWVKPEDGT